MGSGCAGRGNEEVLARIDKTYTITVKDFNDRIEKLPKRYKDVINNNKPGFLDELVADVLLHNEALKRNFDKDAEVRKVIEEAKKKVLIARLLKDEVEDRATVEDAEIKEYYNANPEKFTMPESLRASHILVKTEGEAKDILAELSRGQNFEELARARSIDPTAKIGGDIGYFTRYQLVPEFEEVCFDMKVGEISDVVKTKFGYHIIKLTERKESHVKELPEVHDAVEQALKRIKKQMLFNEFVSRLKEKSQITINKDLLETISEESDSPEEKPER